MGPQSQRGHTAFVHTMISRAIGASGIHVGTLEDVGTVADEAQIRGPAEALQECAVVDALAGHHVRTLLRRVPRILTGISKRRALFRAFLSWRACIW